MNQEEKLNAEQIYKEWQQNQKVKSRINRAFIAYCAMKRMEMMVQEDPFQLQPRQKTILKSVWHLISQKISNLKHNNKPASKDDKHSPIIIDAHPYKTEGDNPSLSIYWFPNENKKKEE